MSDVSQAPESMRFSEALAELEGIVSALEAGQLDLEDSLARYERGVALLRR
jgi:exodeoxyribonuclease VII small subunit